MSVELITAIGSLWKLGVVVLLTGALYVFRSQLRQLLDGLLDVSIKHGNTEFALKGGGKKADLPPIITEATPPAQQAGIPSENKAGYKDASPNANFRSYFDALSGKNVVALDSAFNEWQTSESNADRRLNLTAMHLFNLYCYFGNEEAFGKLRSLARRDEADADVKRWLASAYDTAGEHLKAAEAYQQAAGLCKTEEERAQSLASAAVSLLGAGKANEALTNLMAELGKSDSDEAKSHLYEGLATLYEKTNEPGLRVLALEKALQCRPNNRALRFQAAYGYSQESFSRLAFFHYRKEIEFHSDDASSMNNIGVECGHLRMNAQAIKYYKAASEQGETLAMSNLANIFLFAGFITEANEILDKARSMDKVHPNVGRSIAAASEVWESEQKIENECVETARQQQMFFTAFAEAAFNGRSRPKVESFAGRWKLPDGTEFEITQEGTTVSGSWQVGDSTHSLSGKVINRAFKGIITYRTRMLSSLFTNDEKRIFGHKVGDTHSVRVLTIGKDDNVYEVILCSINDSSASLEHVGDAAGALPALLRVDGSYWREVGSDLVSSFFAPGWNSQCLLQLSQSVIYGGIVSKPRGKSPGQIRNAFGSGDSQHRDKSRVGGRRIPPRQVRQRHRAPGGDCSDVSTPTAPLRKTR